ncbi:hypothetical protein [Candidatus Oscillochloris fontis]|uniref:hypothetical protein n=1 Tax=Candidatus Oscillochloris fontis TaxID=2496868 RepID=UPI00101DE376|nr:hypothetical protein [Candidatus Oscillochloris fontis]
MNIGIWLTSAVGAAVLAATLAVAPITSAQQATPTDESALVLQGQGQGRGQDQGHGHGQGQDQGQRGPQSDGTCSGDNFVDADGDGVCDNTGSGTGTGTNYTDADGDGVCDNMGSGTGTGNQSRHGNQ